MTTSKADPLQDVHIQLGKDFLSAGNFGEAAAQFSQAIEANPQNDSAWFLKGVASIMQGKLSEGRAYIQRSNTVDIAANMVSVLNGTHRDVTGEIVNLRSRYANLDPYFDRYWWNRLTEVAGKIEPRGPHNLVNGYKLYLKEIMLAENGFFVLIYEDDDEATGKVDWIIQVMRSGYAHDRLLGALYEITSGKKIIEDVEARWCMVNLKHPTRKGSQERYHETAYLIPVRYFNEQDINGIRRIGFNYAGWRSVALNGEAFPKCFVPYIQLYGDKEIKKNWQGWLDMYEEHEKDKK